MFHQDHYQVTRHICTRNCYDTCPMLAYTKGGKIACIKGDKGNGASERLCAKAGQYLTSVYHPQRILHPLRQNGRGTGRWQPISWDEALTTIARKILSLKERFHSTLPLCLNKYSGNFGLLHYASEGMFNGLGPTTQMAGTPCYSAGLDAQMLDMGGNETADIRQMLRARLIILWGVNPAWTSVHTMPIIYAAREQGARILVIDPVYTETARKADFYVEIRPGSDSALALLILQELQRRNCLTFDEKTSTGAPELLASLQQIPYEELLAATGQKRQTIKVLAGLIAQNKPMHIWCGFGLQRHVQGGLALRLIDALAYLTGNLGIAGGGVNFAHQDLQLFPHFARQNRPDTRFVNINNFAQSLQALDNPPIKFLWLAGRNLLRQDAGLEQLHQLWPQLEMVVAADKFMTHSAQMADIVLPVTTEFEELDVYGGYFRHFIGLNEPAIPPRGEAKSDLEIARLLTRRLNELAPGTSTFPAHLSDEEFLTREFPPAVCQKLGISQWQDLYNGPVRYHSGAIPWKDSQFATSDGKFHCLHLPDKLCQLFPSPDYPFQLLTPHAQDCINSQNHTLQEKLPEYPLVAINPATARELGLTENVPVILENEQGQLTVIIKFNPELAPDVLLSLQGSSRHGGLNRLNPGLPTDLGQLTTAAPGVALYDVFVRIRRPRQSP